MTLATEQAPSKKGPADRAAVRAVLGALHDKAGSVLDQYAHLAGLRYDESGLFFEVLKTHPDETLPIVYTPGVGEVCQAWGRLPRPPRALRLTADMRDRFAEALREWPHAGDTRIVVVTDGHRILGLGDLGANGVGISVGKALLYSAAAGVHPDRVLPVVLDVGCGSEEVRRGDAYVGDDRPRLEGADYEALVGEFHAAVREALGGERVLIHFEDFDSTDAASFLRRFRDAGPTFNDDIQSTAAVTLAAVLGACKRERVPAMRDHVFCFFGAGQASLGIAALLAKQLVGEGLSEDEARRRMWMLDSKGLIGEGREHVTEAKAAFAQPRAACERAGIAPGAPLLEAVRAIKPTCLVGAAGKGGTFTRDILAALHDGAPCGATRIVLALSNPTDNSECSFQDAWDATGGDVVFAAGSPFPEIRGADGATVRPSQANNAMIFPGLGAGVIAAGATRVPDTFFQAAARALADETSAAEAEEYGMVLPSVSRIRDAAVAVAARVCVQALRDGVSGEGGDEEVMEAARAVHGDEGDPDKWASLRRAVERTRF